MSDKIPDGWRKVKLGNVCKLMRGKGLSKGQVSDTGKNKCILYGELYTTYDEIIHEVKSRTDESDGTPSKKGDILIPGSTTTTGIDLANAVALNEDGVLLGGDINILRKKDDSYNSEFLAYYLTHIKKGEIMRLTQGITIVHLYGKHLQDIELLLPPRELQDKLVDIIKTTDETIYETDNIIKESEKIKKGLLRELTSIFFKKYPIKKISEIAKVTAGGTPSTTVNEYWDGNVKWLSSGEIHNKFIYDSEKYITEKGLKNSSAKLLPADSILLALNGQGRTRGTVAVLKVEASCNQSLACIIPNKKIIDYMFLFYNLQSRYYEIRHMAGSTGREGLNLSLIKLLKVPVPELKTQREYAQRIESLDHRINLEQSKKAKLLKLKISLIQKLLTGQICVRVK